MAVRCDGCDGKFGANGEAEYEIESYDINQTTVTADVTINIPCANCGGELKTGTLNFEQEIDTSEHDQDCQFTVNGEDGEEVAVTFESDQVRFEELAEERTFSITDVDAQVEDDYTPKTKTVRDRKTGELTEKRVPQRFQRHIYVVTLTVSIDCEACGGSFEAVMNDQLGASELEPVN